jgi:hypothetical protein
MNTKKVLIWIGVAFAVWMIIQAPLSAARIVRSGENQINHGARSGQAFISNALPSNP